jgi:uncharacterized protein YndB with AHSA1/START domain
MTHRPPSAGTSTRASRIIRAPRESLYRALLDPAALVAWLPPGEMTGAIHHFDARPGGGYEMSLFYPPSEQAFRGKTAQHEDRFTVRFVALTPPGKIVQAVTFDSPDQAFAGEMTVIWIFEPADGGSEVTVECNNIPPGIRPADNEAGSRMSLDQLARYVQSRT